MDDQNLSNSEELNQNSEKLTKENSEKMQEPEKKLSAAELLMKKIADKKNNPQSTNTESESSEIKKEKVKIGDALDLKSEKKEETIEDKVISEEKTEEVVEKKKEVETKSEVVEEEEMPDYNLFSRELLHPEFPLP